MSNALSAPFIFLIDPKNLPQVLNETIRIDMGLKTLEEASELAEN